MPTPGLVTLLDVKTHKGLLVSPTADIAAEELWEDDNRLWHLRVNGLEATVDEVGLEMLLEARKRATEAEYRRHQEYLAELSTLGTHVRRLAHDIETLPEELQLTRQRLGEVGNALESAERAAWHLSESLGRG